MKMGKKIAALGLALALTASLAACGNSGGSAGTGGEKPKEPAEVIKASQEKISTVKSMNSLMVMDMAISMEDKTLSMKTSMDMVLFTDPAQMKIDMTVDMGEAGKQEMTMYAQSNGSNFDLYAFDGNAWNTQTMPAETMGQYDARSSMELYLNSAGSFQAAGTETLSGGAADKFTGVISGDSLQKVMENSGALSSMSTITGGDDVKSLLSDMGDMPITVWVDQANGYPVRYSMDMSNIMSKVMEKAMADAGADGAGLKVDKMEITMDCSNFDQAPAITIPAEALAAAG